MFWKKKKPDAAASKYEDPYTPKLICPLCKGELVCYELKKEEKDVNRFAMECGSCKTRVLEVAVTSSCLPERDVRATSEHLLASLILPLGLSSDSSYLGLSSDSSCEVL